MHVAVEVRMQIGIEGSVQLALDFLDCLELLHMLERCGIQQTVMVHVRFLGKHWGWWIIGNVPLLVRWLHILVIVLIVVFGWFAFAFHDHGRLDGRGIG